MHRLKITVAFRLFTTPCCQVTRALVLRMDKLMMPSVNFSGVACECENTYEVEVGPCADWKFATLERDPFPDLKQWRTWATYEELEGKP